MRSGRGHLSLLERALYKRAFPLHDNLQALRPPNELVALVRQVWTRNEDLHVLCFGYGFGVTEAFLLKGIEVVANKQLHHNAHITLLDTRSTEELYEHISARPRITHDRIRYRNQWWENSRRAARDEYAYDIVTAYFCLHFIPEWPLVLRWLARRVKPNGLISFSVERGYRASIDGATAVCTACNCACQKQWQKYHDIRVERGDGWFPDISASDMGVVSQIGADDFSLVTFNGNEQSLRVQYPANHLSPSDIKKAVSRRNLFFPLENSTPKLLRTEQQNQFACKDVHDEYADLFFLRRRSQGVLWNDENSYLGRVSTALLSHATRLQTRITMPLLRRGIHDEDYLDEMRAGLRNMLSLLGMHFIRHCREAACEMVFVKYTKMSELYDRYPGARLYVERLPMLMYGNKAWRTMHKSAYTKWRRYLSYQKPEAAWIGQYVMELFPWVGAWEIIFDASETAASMRKCRYSPHFEGGRSAWQSMDHIDILDIAICTPGTRQRTPRAQGHEGERRFEWIEDTDPVAGSVRVSVIETALSECASVENVLKTALENAGYDAVPKLTDLSTLLVILAEINQTSGCPWRKIHYLSVPQASVRGLDFEGARECSGVGVIVYSGADTPFALPFTDAILQLMLSMLRMSQIQMQYLHLHEKQAVYSTGKLPTYYKKYTGLTDKVIDEIYEAIFPAESLEAAYGITRQIFGISVSGLSPAHGDDLESAIRNAQTVKCALKADEQLADIVEYICHAEEQAKDAGEIVPYRLKAVLGRHKGSFVPIDLATHLWKEIDESRLSDETTNVGGFDAKAWAYRAMNRTPYVFWDVYSNLYEYTKSVVGAWNLTTFLDISYICSDRSSVICVSCEEVRADDASAFMEFAGNVMRGAIPYGGQQAVVRDLMALRERLGCNDLGIYASFGKYSRDEYLQHGEAIAARHHCDIAIWLSSIKVNVNVGPVGGGRTPVSLDLVIWIRHKEA